MALLVIEGLRVGFPSGDAVALALDGVDLVVAPGEAVGLVGESGSGKSLTALTILQIQPRQAEIVAGSIRFRGETVLGADRARLRKLRGGAIGMVFQEPTACLNPVLTIGRQVAEAVVTHKGAARAAAQARAIDLLAEVGLPDPARAAASYPHQLSGGMQQRAMIAMALAGDPELLIADECTTALDVTVAAQILALLRGERRRRAMALLLISHDLGVVAENTDRVCVMYAGQIVEAAPTATLFRAPQHPYTRALLAALPGRSIKRRTAIPAIPGSVPRLGARPQGCAFAPRCASAFAPCTGDQPQLSALAGAAHHQVRCHLYGSRP
jgi:oligopeptide/dipeptide ABC transporter ATP-binding protein